MQCKLTMPARVAGALPFLLVIAGCGASEPSGPQLPCSEVYQKVYQVARQLDRDDLEIMDLFAQIPLGQPEKRTQACARARTWVQQQKEVQKLARDNTDRCKEFDFSPANIGSMSMASPGISGTLAESGACK